MLGRCRSAGIARIELRLVRSPMLGLLEEGRTGYIVVDNRITWWGVAAWTPMDWIGESHIEWATKEWPFNEDPLRSLRFEEAWAVSKRILVEVEDANHGRRVARRHRIHAGMGHYVLTGKMSIQGVGDDIPR